MFCGKCGAENENESKVCRKCGASLEPAGGAANKTGGRVSGNVAAPQMQKGKLIAIAGAVAAVVAVVVILAVVLSGGRSYGSAAEEFIDAVFQADGEAVVGLMPEEMAEFITESSFSSRNQMIEGLDAELEQVCRLFDQYYPGWKYSCKVTGAEDSPSLERIRRNYDGYGVEVSGAKIVSVEITIKYDGKEDSETVRIPVIQCGKSWYFDFENGSLEDIFSSSGSSTAFGSDTDTAPSESFEPSTSSDSPESASSMESASSESVEEEEKTYWESIDWVRAVYASEEEGYAPVRLYDLIYMAWEYVNIRDSVAPDGITFADTLVDMFECPGFTYEAADEDAKAIVEEFLALTYEEADEIFYNEIEPAILEQRTETGY